MNRFRGRVGGWLRSTLRPLPERVIADRDFEPVRDLSSDVVADDAVAFVRARKPGTGFLIAANRLMTNNHVIPDADSARRGTATFGYRRAADGTIAEGERIPLDPDAHFATNAELDYTVVGVARVPSGIKPIDIRTGATVAVGDDVYVVGHPRGRPQEVVRDDTKVTRVDGVYLGYRADTEPQSSGSPVFDTQWKLVALHHRSAELGRDDRGNEGVLMSAIVEDMRDRPGA